MTDINVDDIGGNPKSWYAIDADGARVRIGDLVRTDSGNKCTIIGFGVFKGVEIAYVMRYCKPGYEEESYPVSQLHKNLDTPSSLVAEMRYAVTHASDETNIDDAALWAVTMFNRIQAVGK